jgi:hypothetical protein
MFGCITIVCVFLDKMMKLFKGQDISKYEKAHEGCKFWALCDTQKGLCCDKQLMLSCHISHLLWGQQGGLKDCQKWH